MTLEEKLQEFEDTLSQSVKADWDISASEFKSCLAMLKKAIEQRDRCLAEIEGCDYNNFLENAELIEAGKVNYDPRHEAAR